MDLRGVDALIMIICRACGGSFILPDPMWKECNTVVTHEHCCGLCCDRQTTLLDSTDEDEEE